MKISLVISTAFAFLVIGCGSSSNTTKDTAPVTVTDTVTDTAPVTDTATDNGTGQETAALAAVGGPCQDGTECETGFCLTTETLTSLLDKTKPLEVPDGYCTKLMCSANTDCGTKGKCVDLQDFELQAFACFASCDTTDPKACRKDYTCFDDPRIKDVAGSPGFAVCIPGSLIGLLPPLNAEGAEDSSSE